MKESLQSLSATMRGIRTTDPTGWCLAAITRGLTLDLPPKVTRNWIARNGSRSATALISSDRSYTRLTSIARQHLSDSSSPSSAARRSISISRLIVARVLAPLETDAGPRVQVRDRSAIAAIGLAQLRRPGWRTVAVSRGWLALELGISEPSAGRALASLDASGWLRCTARPPGKPAVFQLCRLGEERSRETARAHYDPIGGLATDDLAVPGVMELLSVGHPAWGYSPAGSTPRLGHRHWLRAIALATSTGPESVGQTDRSWALSLADLRRAGVLDDAGALATGALDRYAERAGAVDARAVAVVRREERIAERMESLAAARQARAGAIAGLKRVYKTVGKPPPATADREIRQAWLQRVQPALAGVPEQGRTAVRAELSAALRRAGWGSEPARAAAAWALAA